MTIEPIPRTLYTHPDKCAMVCLGDGSGWLVPDQLRTVGGWEIDSSDMEGRSPALFDLTDDEILRLCGAEGLAATIAEIGGRPDRVAAILASRAKAARHPQGSTLYLTPREPAVLHESGNLWILYAAGSQLSPPRPVPSEWIEIAQDLTSAEVASLVDPDKRLLAIFKILSARKPAPGGCDEAEIERWRKAAERAEADRQEWQALCLNHEGAIERLTRERDHYRALVRAALEAASAGEMADERLPEIVQTRVETVQDLLNERARLRQVIVGLAAKIAGVRSLTAESPDPR